MSVVHNQVYDEQVVCWNCEETVHESAVQCPYCYVELNRHQLERPKQHQTPFADLPEQSPSTISQAGEKVAFLFSLFFLLMGSALFFLAVLISFFARDGEFVLRWPETSWPAFFGLGMAMLAFGTLFAQKLSNE